MTALLLLLTLAALTLSVPFYWTARDTEREAGWWAKRTAAVEAAFEQAGRARGRAERRVPSEWKEAA